MTNNMGQKSKGPVQDRLSGCIRWQYYFVLGSCVDKLSPQTTVSTALFKSLYGNANRPEYYLKNKDQLFPLPIQQNLTY